MPKLSERFGMGEVPANLGLTSSHAGEHDLVLDLWMGFSESIFLHTSNKGGDIDFWSPIFYDRPFSSYQADVELNRTLQTGLLEFATGDGEAILLDTKDLDACPIDERPQRSRAQNGRQYPLTRANPKLLRRLRHLLVPGKAYGLRFCGRRFKMWCKDPAVAIWYVPGYQNMSPIE